MKTKKVSRVLALLLSLVMLLGALPTAFAESSVVITEWYYEEMAQAAAEELYARLMGSTNYIVLEIELGNIVDEQLEKVMLRLSEEERSEYEAYVLELYKKATTSINVPVGPFFPAVDVTDKVSVVSTFSLARNVTALTDADNGLELSKKVESTGNAGEYKVTLEVWTTGDVTTETTTKPVDIVLVLDQSSSMKSGKLTDGTGYQEALYSAVNDFIGQVCSKYNASTADHRIAIVTFYGDAQVALDWQPAVSTNFSNFLTRLESGSYLGSGTMPDKGMKLAVDLMDEEANHSTKFTGSYGYDYTGNNTERQRVVIMFADGCPSNKEGPTYYNSDVADDAINYGATLKKEGCTSYSVGIFLNADSSQLYGTQSANGTAGAEGYYWKKDYAAAGNRYLNYLSSNSIGTGTTFTNIATDDGLSATGSEGSQTFTITEDGYQWSNNGYYQTASTASGLTSIFKQISNNIVTPTIDLGTDTIIRDIVTPTFELPGDTETEQIQQIKFYTQDYDGSDFVDTRVEIAPLTVDIDETAEDGSTKIDVSVNGFNFNDNCISDTNKNSDTPGATPDYGRKLIIEFVMKTKAGFLGGNYIPTNGENSGVYENSSAASALENFTVPHVNMPVITPSVELTDKYVYLLDDVSFEQMYPYNSTTPGAATNCIIVYDTYNNPITLDISQANGGLAEWQTKYADLTIDLSTKSDYDDLTEDKTFTAEVTIDVDTSTLATIGIAASDQSDDASASIYVFKPVLTFSDYLVDYQSEIDETSYSYTADGTTTEYTYFGQNLQSKNEDGNAVKPVWVNGSKAYDEDKMLYDEPPLTLTYTPTAGVTNGKVSATNYVPVKVTVAIGSEPVTSYTTFVHDPDCTDTTCEWNAESMKNGEPAFLLHVENVVGNLKITKTVDWNGKTDGGQVFMFKVTGTTTTGGTVDMVVSIAFDGNTDSSPKSITIKDLPAGTYSVTEIQNDNRFTLTESSYTTNIAVNGSVNPEATFTNKLTNDKWLDGEARAENIFTNVTTPSTAQ